MQVIIIEDEKLSAQHLSNTLLKIDATIQVLHYFESVKQSISAFTKGITADLLFVDIHLADGLSFEIFKNIELHIPIIFTTAFDNYAINAFKLNSIDYLLKPIEINDLKFALEKFKKNTPQNANTILENITQVYEQITKQYKTRFLVKSSQNILTISTQEILHFISIDSISFLVLENGKRYAVDYTLDVLETLLNPQTFFRINRQVILNITAIEKINTHFNNRLFVTSKHLSGDAPIVSRDRVTEFKTWLDN